MKLVSIVLKSSVKSDPQTLQFKREYPMLTLNPCSICESIRNKIKQDQQCAMVIQINPSKQATLNQ
jgi:hypothetical protein